MPARAKGINYMITTTSDVAGSYNGMPTADKDLREILLAKDPTTLTEAEKTALWGPSAQAPATSVAAGAGAAPNQPVTEQETCGICGKPVEAGQRVTTETIHGMEVGVKPYRRLVHVSCQANRASEGRIGDPETDQVESPAQSKAAFDAKKHEVERKAGARSDHDAMGANPRKDEKSDPYDVSNIERGAAANNQSRRGARAASDEQVSAPGSDENRGGFFGR